MAGVMNMEVELARCDEVDKLLVGMGLPINLLMWFGENDMNYDYAPID
jgi:hypothetical protein